MSIDVTDLDQAKVEAPQNREHGDAPADVGRLTRTPHRRIRQGREA